MGVERKSKRKKEVKRNLIDGIVVFITGAVCFPIANHIDILEYGYFEVILLKIVCIWMIIFGAIFLITGFLGLRTLDRGKEGGEKRLNRIKCYVNLFHVFFFFGYLVLTIILCINHYDTGDGSANEVIWIFFTSILFLRAVFIYILDRI